MKTTPRFYRQWMIAGNPSHFIDRLIQDFGDYVHYRGLINFYLINDPALIREVLNNTHRTFDKNTIIYNQFRNALGNSLVNAEGTHWRRQRKLIQPAFQPQSIRKFFRIMRRSSLDLAKRREGFAGRRTAFNLSNELTSLTLEIAGKSLFSDGFKDVAAEIAEWARIINTYSARPPIPILTNARLPTPLNLKLKKALKAYRTFIDRMIDERLRIAPQDDLLAAFLGMRDEETGAPMEDSEIAEEGLGMIIGGHETSSTALSWTFYELGRNPEIEMQVFEEIHRVLDGDDLEFEQINELPLCKMVIQEAMRLHPPLWFENRNAMKNIELGGQLIPKGSMIIMSRYALHRNPRYWNQPDTFDPTRFDPANPNLVKIRESGAYLPFSSGPRICIGRHFAMTEIIVILCTVLQKFRVKLLSEDPIKEATNLTMEPQNGIRVRLERRHSQPKGTRIFQ